MAVYLEMEESIVDTDTSLKDDLMGLSLLALLVSPWAALALAVSLLGNVILSTEMTLVCISVLLAAAPKLLQLLFPHQEHLQHTKHAA